MQQVRRPQESRSARLQGCRHSQTYGSNYAQITYHIIVPGGETGLFGYVMGEAWGGRSFYDNSEYDTPPAAEKVFGVST